MNSQRQKREEEIERLTREAGLGREPDLAFQEEVRKTASDILEKEALKIKTERVEKPKRSISPATGGWWVLVIGTAISLSIPSLGAVLIVCGIAAIVWASYLKSSKK
jgi:hypothetical protein